MNYIEIAAIAAEIVKNYPPFDEIQPKTTFDEFNRTDKYVFQSDDVQVTLKTKQLAPELLSEPVVLKLEMQSPQGIFKTRIPNADRLRENEIADAVDDFFQF